MAADDPPSTPPHSGWPSMEEELAYYKAQYETLEVELQEFQASSKELEAELEKDVEESEKRERKLQEKVEGLGYQVDEWKVNLALRRDTSAANNATRNRLLTSPRQNTNKARPRLTTLKVRSRRRLPLCANRSARSSCNSEMSRFRTTTLSGRRATRLLRSRISSQSTTWPLNVPSC